MQQHLIELSVGDTLQVGQYRVTVLQINGDEMSIEVDGNGDGEFGWNEDFASESAAALDAY